MLLLALTLIGGGVFAAQMGVKADYEFATPRQLGEQVVTPVVTMVTPMPNPDVYTMDKYGNIIADGDRISKFSVSYLEYAQDEIKSAIEAKAKGDHTNAYFSARNAADYVTRATDRASRNGIEINTNFTNELKNKANAIAEEELPKR